MYFCGDIKFPDSCAIIHNFEGNIDLIMDDDIQIKSNGRNEFIVEWE